MRRGFPIKILYALPVSFSSVLECAVRFLSLQSGVGEQLHFRTTPGDVVLWMKVSLPRSLAQLVTFPPSRCILRQLFSSPQHWTRIVAKLVQDDAVTVVTNWFQSDHFLRTVTRSHASKNKWPHARHTTTQNNGTHENHSYNCVFEAIRVTKAYIGE
jgi:hypothetical protein